jgi:hypothetical protein
MPQMNSLGLKNKKAQDTFFKRSWAVHVRVSVKLDAYFLSSAVLLGGQFDLPMEQTLLI